MISADYERRDDSALAKPVDICLFHISIHMGLLSNSFQRSTVSGFIVAANQHVGLRGFFFGRQT